MITKLRKAQDSWVAKSILVLTALSFMSLFGISGYINGAAGNRAVIKVNDRTVSQLDVNQQLDQEIRTAQKLFGDIEITDEIRNQMLAGLVQRDLNSMITEETAAKNKVSVSDALVRNIIFSQVQFLDDDGQFSRERLNYFLSQSNWSEQQYVDTIRSDLKKQYLVQNPASGFNVPAVLKKYAAAAEAQRKVFKYISVDDRDAVIDRGISEEEINQYYNDFGTEFVEPETRDAEFVVLSTEDIAKHIEVTEDEIDEYYKSNLSQFVTPETRNVLQMLFENEEDAKAAKAALDNGADFYQVAREKAGQTDEETNLEYVSEDMLIGDTGAKVFAAAKNEAVGPIQSELGWHIMKATDIKAGSKEDESKVKKQIAQTIANEKVYEVAYDIINGIEDKIGAGSSLEEIAEDMGVKTYRIKGMKENGEAASLPGSYASVLTGSDFIDAVFSYNKGEISQAVETDEGFVFVKVDNITDSHPQSIETALPKIKKMWRENEKSAITQELINDVMHDLESGDDISEAAGRYNLKVVTTEPLTRSQSFAGLSQPQMLELFNDAARTPKQIDRETQHIIAVAGKDAEPRKLSAEETDIIAGRLNLDLTQEAAAALIDSYGKDYDIRVKYRLLGLAD